MRAIDYATPILMTAYDERIEQKVRQVEAQIAWRVRLFKLKRAIKLLLGIR